ncbi:hypothetical protein [Sphingobacterium corticibacter]|uniref:hypothetical protein n=1 Tax=Sphingobacterium corticibacter TaxID=2171749 RepID=UPI0013FDEC07|nr:hypothetical protein [Sphingobacterium corticibacter]
MKFITFQKQTQQKTGLYHDGKITDLNVVDNSIPVQMRDLLQNWDQNIVKA